MSIKCFSDLLDRIYGGIGERDSGIGVIPGHGHYNYKKIILVLNIPDLLNTFPFIRFLEPFLDMMRQPKHINGMDSATSMDFLYQRFMLELTKYYIDECKKEKKLIYIVFYSTAWNSKLWIEYEKYFRDQKNYLRMVDSKETILKV